MIENIYMIRNGALGTNFEMKVLFTTVGVLICLYDWLTRRRKDYLWVFLLGAMGGFLAEWALQVSGNRVMPQNYLWGYPIPIWASALLRATCEGSAFMIVCLFFTDRLLEGKGRLRWCVFLLLTAAFIVVSSLVGRHAFKDIGGLVASRRHIFEPKVVLGLLGLMFFDAAWLAKAKKPVYRRAMYFFLIVAVLTSCWTMAEYAANTRWIEIARAGYLLEAAPLLEFIVFVWDILAETAFIYLAFLALPYILGLIKSPITDDQRTYLY